METKIRKETKMKKESAYDKWLKNLIGEKILFEELDENEIYQIILKIAKITFNRNQILNQDHTFEDAAGIIYRNFLQRDQERDLSDTITEGERNTKAKMEEYPYYDEKSGTYFKKWKPRAFCKGFNKMRQDHITVAKFSNLIFTEMNNHVNWHKRDTKFYNRLNNTSSLDAEIIEGSTLGEVIKDENDYYQDVEKVSGSNLSFLIRKAIAEDKENDSHPNLYSTRYHIVIDGQSMILTYKNLIKLYTYLSEQGENYNKRISSGTILNYITYDDKKELSQINIKYIGKFIKSFKDYLQDSGLVECMKFIDDLGKEKKKYGFTQQLY